MTNGSNTLAPRASRKLGAILSGCCCSNAMALVLNWYAYKPELAVSRCLVPAFDRTALA